MKRIKMAWKIFITVLVDGKFPYKEYKTYLDHSQKKEAV